jgi:chromosome segregation ATPase
MTRVVCGLFGLTVLVASSGAAQPPKEAPTPEAQLAALRKEVAAFDKDITALTAELARETVAVKRLEEQFEASKLWHMGLPIAIDVLTKDIKAAEADGGGKVVSGMRTMTVAEAKELLAKMARSRDQFEKPYAALEATLAARVAGRDALQKRLIAVKAQRAALLDTTDAIDIELRVLKPKDGAKVDDAKLAEVKKRLADLQRTLEVGREVLNLSKEAPNGGEPKKP